MSEHRTVAVDLDGTIAHYSGWKGMNHIGDPLPGAKEALAALKNAGYRVVVFTTRALRHEGVFAVWDWLKKYRLEEFVDQVTAQKIPWLVLFDDRCRHVEPNKESLRKVADVWLKEQGNTPS